LVKHTEQSKQSIWGDLLQTDQSTDERTDVPSVKVTSETQNQAVPNTDTANNSISSSSSISTNKDRCITHTRERASTCAVRDDDAK